MKLGVQSSTKVRLNELRVLFKVRLGTIQLITIHTNEKISSNDNTYNHLLRYNNINYYVGKKQLT